LLLGEVYVHKEDYLKSKWRLYAQQTETDQRRKLNPDEISVPPGFQIEVFAEGLNTPIGIEFTENGDMLIADSGYATGNPKVIRLSNGSINTIAEGFNIPITGINYRNGDIYVSHRGVITVVRADGTKQDIIIGLPSYGDFANNRVEFGIDGKMYFGQGTATNSGVVGLDNKWIKSHPYFHDYPGTNVILKGINYETEDILIPAGGPAITGAFSPFGVPNNQLYQMKNGALKASGSILRANPDGSNLEMVAWGLRNPFYLKFDGFNRLIISNWGLDNRGSRPIANGLDEIQLFNPGVWYGWPDYSGGEPISLSRFTPINGVQPQQLLESIPSAPPKPIAVLPAGSTIMGFDFNKSRDFGVIGDIFIANFGRIQYEESEEFIRSGVGHRVTRVNVNTGELSTFAINKVGFPQEAGFGRPTDVTFGPDGAMYISDFSIGYQEKTGVYKPNTGVIWRISKM
jgi:glucose/arabinose dehydrogenase